MHKWILDNPKSESDAQTKNKNFYLYLKTIICSSSWIVLSLDPSHSLISALAVTEENRTAEEKKRTDPV